MTLSFSTKINGKPTFFPEKILNSFYPKEMFHENVVEYMHSQYYNDDAFINCYKAKLHTIREDKSDRWRAGKKIHFVINNRTSNRLQFAPVMDCVSVQRVSIDPKTKSVFIVDEVNSGGIKLEYSLLLHRTVEALALNDGFESVEDFWNYFDKPFTGKIIHWTKLTY